MKFVEGNEYEEDELKKELDNGVDRCGYSWAFTSKNDASQYRVKERKKCSIHSHDSECVFSEVCLFEMRFCYYPKTLPFSLVTFCITN